MTSSLTTRRLALAGASGIAYALAFPPFDLSSIAFVALVPLLLAIRGASIGVATMLGWVAGTIGVGVLVAPSIFTATTRYFGGSSALALVLALVLPQIYGALYFALFATCARAILLRLRGPVAATLALPSAWAACELARSRLGTGAPWILLAHTQHAHPALLGVADLGGAPAVSWLVALVNAALASAIARGAGSGGPPPAMTGRLRGVAVAGALVAAATAYGGLRTAGCADGGRETLRVAVVHAGASAEHWRPALGDVRRAVDRYAELMRGAAVVDAALVVWPESAISVPVEANTRVLAGATAALGSGGRLLVGSPRTIAMTPSRSALRNSAFLLDRDARIVGVYDKRRLTPYGEFTPWLARPFVTAASIGAEYSPGAGPMLLELAGWRFAALICYEAIYPELVRASVRDGAELLVNISNDDWFADGAAVVQHLRAAQLRTVESRRYLVRAAKGGISAIVDPCGRVVTAARDETTTLAAAIAPRSEHTLYTRVGDVFGWACVAATIAIVLPSRRRATSRP